MAWGSKKRGGGGPAWLALIVAVAALWVAWSAFQRTGGRFDDLLSAPGVTAPERVSDGGDWREALAGARERLLRRRDEVEAERDLDAVRRDVEEIRAALERAYRGISAGGEGARDTWNDLDHQLGRLEEQLGEGSGRARETLDDLLRKMKDAG